MRKKTGDRKGLEKKKKRVKLREGERCGDKKKYLREGGMGWIHMMRLYL